MGLGDAFAQEEARKCGARANTPATRRRDISKTERVKLVETGNAFLVLKQYNDELDDTVMDENPSALAAWRAAQQKTTLAVHNRAAEGVIRQARAALNAGLKVANDGRTLNELLRGLVPVGRTNMSGGRKRLLLMRRSRTSTY